MFIVNFFLFTSFVCALDAFSITGSYNREECGDLILQSKKSRICDKQSSVVHVNKPLSTISVTSITHSSALNKSIPPLKKTGRPKLDKTSKRILFIIIIIIFNLFITLFF